MTRGTKRALAAILLVIACGTATSGATFTSSSGNAQGFAAAADFGVHVAVDAPSGPLRGTATVTATADDTGGGTIAQVEIQRSPAGAGTWTTICTDSTGPAWSCSLNTTALADGRYDLRARATSSTGYARTSQTLADVIVDNAAPTVVMEDPGTWFGGTVTLRSTSGDNAAGSGVATVRYEVKPSAGTTWSTACTASSAPFSCSYDASALTNGTAYDLRAVATDRAGNATTSATLPSRRVDSAAPTGTLTDPGANVRGSVSLAASAADAHSGVASVRVQYSAAGAGAWTDVCTDTSSPYSCTWDTTVLANGLYDLRMIAVDVAGNALTSPVVAGRRVDNGLPIASMTDPGSPLSGTVTLNAAASDAESGVANVRIQYSAAGAGAWNDVCTDASTPYSCTANTAGVGDGLYDFRSVATDNANNLGYSATVANRRVDNFAPSGSDVQTADGGGTPGVIQPGDSITLTYSEDIDPATIVAGWNGSGGQTVHVRFAHHNQGDRLTFWNASNNVQLALAGGPGVVLEGEYVASAATYSAALTTTTHGFRVTLVALLTGAVRTTPSPASAMVWTPASGARDFLGKACSTTARTEVNGAADAEF